MSRFRLAANLAFLYKERPLLERFAAARTSGFAGVELGFPYDNPIDELVQAKQNAGVEIVLISTPPGNWDNGDRGLAAIPGRQKEFRESIATAIQYATALKCQRYIPLTCTETYKAKAVNLSKTTEFTHWLELYPKVGMKQSGQPMKLYTLKTFNMQLTTFSKMILYCSLNQSRLFLVIFSGTSIKVCVVLCIVGQKSV
jgi:hydroxypyruvate isomerase